ncbi:MAG: FG-GAP-like repeat-containing protein [Planctomycetota bacterium]
MTRLPILALCLLSPALASQTTYPILPYTAGVIPWPTATPGTFSRSVAGRFRADEHRDTVVLHGTSLSRALAPGLYNAVFPVDVGRSVHDIVRMPGGNGALDAVFVSLPAANSVIRVYWDATTGAQQTELTALAGWMAATPLASTAGVAAGTSLIAGVSSADQRTILRVAFDGTQFVPAPINIIASSDVQDLALLDWNGDGVPDIAALGTDSLEIFAGTGALLHSEPTPIVGADGAIAVFDGALAWLRRDAPDEYFELRLVASGGGTGTLQVRLDDVDFDLVGMASGDADGDGDLDLFITQNTTAEALVLRQGDTGLTAIEFPLAASSPTGINQCSAAIADYDGDGTADYLQWSQDENGGVRAEGFGTPLGSPAPNVGEILFDESELWIDIGPDDLDRFDLFLHVPELAEIADKLQIIGWVEDPQTGMVTTSFYNGVFTFAGGSTTGHHFASLDPPDGVIPRSPVNVYWELRFSKDTEAFPGPTVMVGASFTEPTPMGPIPAALQALAVAGADFMDVAYGGMGSGSGGTPTGGRIIIGTTVRVVTTGPFINVPVTSEPNTGLVTVPFTAPG